MKKICFLLVCHDTNTACRFDDIDNFLQESMRNDPNSFSYSSSSVMSYSNDGSGQPAYYHAASSERKGPGGVCSLA